MAQHNLEPLLAPVSDESPAGPDLEYDPEFLALERAAAPKAERAVGDAVKAAEEPDWGKVIELSEALLARSKDLRVAVHLTTAWLRREGVLEISLVVGARGQQYHEGRLAIGWSDARQAILEGAEEVGHRHRLQFPEGIGTGTGEDDAVLQRVACTGRTLGPIGDNPPVTVWRAGDVYRVELEINATRRYGADAGPAEGALAIDQGGGQQTLCQQPLFAIQVRQHGVEQSGSLSHRGRQFGPLLGGHEERQGVQFPGALGALGVAVDVVV